MRELPIEATVVTVIRDEHIRGSATRAGEEGDHSYGELGTGGAGNCLLPGRYSQTLADGWCVCV